MLPIMMTEAQVGRFVTEERAREGAYRQIPR